MIVPALLGITALSETTPAFSYISETSTPSGIPTIPDGWTGAVPGDPQTAQGPRNRATSGPYRVLTGLIAYTDPRQGFAIIGSSVRNTFLVRAGQQLPDGSWIREIHPEHVVLEHGGSLEALRMYQRGESAGSAYVPISLRPQSARWEEADGTTAGEARSNQAEPAGTSPIPRPFSDPRRSEMQANEVRTNDAMPSNTSPSDVLTKQAPPEAPVPQAQDPADEFGDEHRQRADSRRK
jgi:Type II secretion system protein C